MRVFNIPATEPFLPRLARALLDGELIEGFRPRDDVRILADATIYLPTRRACTALRDVFLAEFGGRCVLLPSIIALGDIDEDEIDFAAGVNDALGGAAHLDLAPAMGPTERRLVLASLVERWAQLQSSDAAARAPLVVTGAQSAIGLADDLARLMDDMITRQVPWSRFDQLVPDELAEYWQHTLAFLNTTMRTWWPEILDERGMIEAALRRDRLIAAECTRLAAHARGPVIAAGSTGSMPATARFLHAVAALRQGALVLPGLDTVLDDAAWNAIQSDAHDDATDASPIATASVSHPQFALRGLLARLHLTRADVVDLSGAKDSARTMLVSEALRPANTTQDWALRLNAPDIAAQIERAMADIAVIEAATSQQEALAIAVAMRGALHDRQRATLVTPDRLLARRVASALARWNIAVEDSGGERLCDTSAGRFAMIAAEAGLRGLEPATLLAFLKHPVFRLGRDAQGWHAAANVLECAVLRGTRPLPGTKGLLAALDAFRIDLAHFRSGRPSGLHHSEPRAQLADGDLVDALALAHALQTALAPLEQLAMQGGAPRSLAAIAAEHRAVLALLTGENEAPFAAFDTPDGAMLIDALDELASDAGAQALSMSAHDYGEALGAILGDRVVRQRAARDPQLQILGPLEARLGAGELMILGGLSEGVWPPQTRTDAWLSRAMRQQIGLDAPERRIGLSAHDFAQFMGAPRVILSHAAKVDGAPAVASRFVHRLRAVTSEKIWDAARMRGQRYLDLAAQLDWPAHASAEPTEQPMPRPALALRPKRLSVTAIETLIRDPYSIYAEHILRLIPLDPVDMSASVGERGSAIHEALGAFAQAYPDRLPADIEGELLRIGRDAFAGLMALPEARALWWPRFVRIAAWYAEWERERRAGATQVLAESSGRLVLDIAGSEFVLSARADRIECLADGSHAIIDFKTGNPPSAKQVNAGLHPQLTLEAAMLRAGGFSPIAPGGHVAALTYVRLSGGTPAGEMQSALGEEGSGKGKSKTNIAMTPDEAADHARQKLVELLSLYADEQTPYKPLALAQWRDRYGKYDHLARIKEWSAEGGGDFEGGES